ncbi:mRNA turnover protein 4 homolog [Dendronephthya gigantea]|uniref:mRNA turnover protein 4 homolog n=1 Tax=Dendronephthya gigantea TaxID=151771 RepID=UPI00106C1F9E|nr:mRNA turnover protein 4 homolog [Dendronephthya gigantea]
MPKSKRNKLVSLTQTTKKGLELKSSLIKEVQECVDKYARIFVFSVENMRNSKLKDVRNEWKHSRFFFGKNKVMIVALGKDKQGEYKENLSKVSKHLKGQRGLLFTNKTKDEVLQWFSEFKELDFARSGNIATHDLRLDAGPLDQFTHSMEPNLRQLGLPTSLQKGKVVLLNDHEVCKTGDVLTPEQARILKLMGNPMAEFCVTLVCVWSNDGTFEEFT